MQSFTFQGLPEKLEYGQSYNIVASPEEEAHFIMVTLYRVQSATDQEGPAIARWEENGNSISFTIPARGKPTARRFRPGLYYIEVIVDREDNSGSGTGYTLDLTA